MTLTFDLLTSKSIGHILDSWWVSVWSFMIIGWLQSQLSSGNHFQITMRHDLDLWPFDLKINRAHPWLMVSKCMKFHDHRWITESVIVRKLVWRTDGRTDGQTDRVQTYSPLRFHRWGTKKIKMKIYVFTGNQTIQQPFAFKASALDHWATLTVDKLWFKLFHGMCIKLTRVTKHISNWLWFGVLKQSSVNWNR